MMLVMAGTSVGLVFTFNLPLLMIFRFLIGASTTGSYLCTYVIGITLVLTTLVNQIVTNQNNLQFSVIMKQHLIL